VAGNFRGTFAERTRNTRVASLSTGLCHSDVASAVSFGVQYGTYGSFHL
jgi:hypothetical protein